MEWTDDKNYSVDNSMSSTHVCTMFMIERITIALLFLFFLATASSSDESILFVYVLLVPVCVMCVTVAGTSYR